MTIKQLDKGREINAKLYDLKRIKEKAQYALKNTELERRGD